MPALPLEFLQDASVYVNRMEDEETSIDFCTLGMFIIDEIEFPPPAPPVKDVVGGAGSYSAIGARIFSPPPLSKSVGWIVDCGSDFPQELRETIDQWETSCHLRETPDRLTTRGWNGYGENEHRAFAYTTPKLRLDADSLSPTLLLSKSFHLICSPGRLTNLTSTILEKRTNHAYSRDQWINTPLFIWEPVPDLCVPEEASNAMGALLHVDVVSPNHGELGGFFGVSTVQDNGDVDRAAVEHCCQTWLASGIGANGKGAVVVRCGKDGCYVATRQRSRWLPAVHGDRPEKVVDPTGGGNGFLGGLAVGLVRGGVTPGVQNVEEAAIWGSVAASFAIEQVGMPRLERGQKGEPERWNGVRVDERVKELKEALNRESED